MSAWSPDGERRRARSDRVEEWPDEQDDSSPERPLEQLPDDELVAAMRTSEPAALAEFFARFSPTLLKAAARLRVSRDHREECVMELLGDAALRLSEHRVPRARSLIDYLARSLGNKVLNERKRDGRRGRREDDAMTLSKRIDGVPDEGVIAFVMSSYSRRGAAGPEDGTSDAGSTDDGGTDTVMHPARRSLLSALESAMTDEERRIMGWLGERIEQRLIAEWLGMTHGAFRLRTYRLRGRLVAAAWRHLDAMPQPDRTVVEQLLEGSSDRRPEPASGSRDRGSSGEQPPPAVGEES